MVCLVNGADMELTGGYAIQFSKEKLLQEIESVNKIGRWNYQLQDVYYTTDNPLRDAVLNHSESFLIAYKKHLNELARKIDPRNAVAENPIGGLFGEPLASLLDYLIYTKNGHFGEERECRLSVIDVLTPKAEVPVSYYNRKGIVVPYVKTPYPSFNILKCIDWVIVGPGPRLATRLKSVSQMIRQLGLSISVRPSHIPFSRA